MLSVEELRDYKKWVGRCPVEIREAATKAGGWAAVFPREGKFPRWASRVRNFFNLVPRELKLTSVIESTGRLSRRKRPWPAWVHVGLSGDVYLDPAEHEWFAMTPVGGIYHYKDDVSDWDPYKKAKALFSRQRSMPIFKLVSPDGTGGSSEVCVKNIRIVVEGLLGTSKIGSSTIGPEGKWTEIVTKIVDNQIYQGTYNYSETMELGLPEHNFRDVESHEAKSEFYINPPSVFAPLSTRRFPEIPVYR